MLPVMQHGEVSHTALTLDYSLAADHKPHGREPPGRRDDDLFRTLRSLHRSALLSAGESAPTTVTKNDPVLRPHSTLNLVPIIHTVMLY